MPTRTLYLLLLNQSSPDAWVSTAAAVATLVSGLAVALGGVMSKYYAAKRDLLAVENRAQHDQAQQHIILLEAQLSFVKEQLTDCRRQYERLRRELADCQEGSDEWESPGRRRRPPPSRPEEGQ